MQPFEILATLAGGGSIAGESGKQIQADLNAIFAALRGQPFKVKAIIDPVSLTQMQKQINNVLKNAKINVPVNNTKVKQTGNVKNTSQAKRITDTAKNKNKSIKQLGTLLKEQEKQYKALKKAENALSLAQKKYNNDSSLENEKLLKKAITEKKYADEIYKEANRKTRDYQKNKHINNQMLLDNNIQPWNDRKTQINQSYNRKLKQSTEQEEILQQYKTQKEQQKQQIKAEKEQQKQQAKTQKEQQKQQIKAEKEQQNINKTKVTKSYRDAVNNLNSVLKQQLALENELAGLNQKNQTQDVRNQMQAKADVLRNINKEKEKAKKEVDKYYNEMPTKQRVTSNSATQIVKNARISNQVKRNKAIITSINETHSAMSSLKKDFDDINRYMTTNTKVSKNSDFTKRLQDIQSDLTKAYTIPNKALRNDAVKQAKQELKTWKSEVKAAGLETKTFGETMKSGVKKFTQWYGISNIVMSATTKIKEMWQNVKEVDAAMTELRKVTDESDATYSKFLSNAGERARETGSTISDIVSSTADFARLGYSTEDATNLADAATIYKNVGDGLTDVNEASQSIISTMKAFGVEADGAMQIVDKFNEVGKNIAQLYSNI